MHLDQLRYFIEVSKTSSINAAARNLYMTPAALSTSLQKLEKELNIILYERTSKGIILTENGYNLVKVSQEFLEKLTDIQNGQISPAATTISGTLELITFFSAFENFLCDILRTFFNDYPNITINFHEHAAKDVPTKFLSSSLELALYLTNQPTERYNGITYNHLIDYMPTIWVSKNDPAAQFRFVTPNYLKRYTFICFGNQENHSLEFLYKMEIDPQQIYLAENWTLIKELVAMGKGVALSFLPAKTAKRSSPINGIVDIPIKTASPFSLYILSHTARKLSPPATIFLKYITQYFQFHQ